MTDELLRAADELAIGSRIDRYDVVRHVARGGMGSVWLGRLQGKHGFEKLVAIKTIRQELAAEGRFKAMFLDEARITSRLHHANVAQVLDVGEHASMIYIVFEWVAGQSLEAVCRESEARGSGVDIAFALRTMAEVCAGLHAAHELKDEEGTPLGVVHRDVSPLNVLVGEGGFAKLIDFGVAKARDRVAPETRSGVVKGTPQYMAPEQAMGHEVDRRADIWAAGATLYRALAGRPPFADRDELAAFIGGRPMNELPAATDPDVRAIVKKAMARDPDGRYPTANAMRAALEQVLHSATGRVPAAIGSARSPQAVTVSEGQPADPAFAKTELLASTPAGASHRAGEDKDRKKRGKKRRSGDATNRYFALALILAAGVVVAAAAFSYCG
jgi:eukaryotic-like serine/threonine-protein kinase